MIHICLNTPYLDQPLLGSDFKAPTIIYHKTQKLEYLVSRFITDSFNERIAALNADIKAQLAANAEMRADIKAQRAANAKIRDKIAKLEGFMK